MFTRNNLKELLEQYRTETTIEHGHNHKVAAPYIIVELRKLRKAQTSEKDHRSKRTDSCLPSVLEAIFYPLLDDLKKEDLEPPSPEQLMGWFCKIYEECDFLADPYVQLELRFESEPLYAHAKTHIIELFSLFNGDSKILRPVFEPLFNEVQAALKKTGQEAKTEEAKTDPEAKTEEAKTDLAGVQASELSPCLSPAPEAPAEAALIEQQIIYFEVRQIKWFLENYILGKRSALHATGLDEKDEEFGEALRFYLEGVFFQAASKVMKLVRDELKEENQTVKALEKLFAQAEGLYLFLEELFNLPELIDESTMLILMEEFLAIVEFSKKNPVKLKGFDRDSHLTALMEAKQKTYDFKGQRSQRFVSLNFDSFRAIQESTNAILEILLMDPEAMAALESFTEAVKRAYLDLKRKLHIISPPSDVAPRLQPSALETPLLPRSSPRDSRSAPRTGSGQADRTVVTGNSIGRMASSMAAMAAGLSCCCRFFPRTAEEAAQRLPGSRSKAATAGYGATDDKLMMTGAETMRRNSGPS
jgi:hypothetical protein